MKKLYIIFLILFSAILLAQEKTKIGINTGLTYSNIRGNEIANKNKYDFNYLIGASLELNLNKKISIITNINYERKSFKNTITRPDGFLYEQDPAFVQDFSIPVKVTLHYLSIPINLKFYLGNKNDYYITSGLYSAFFLNSSSDFLGSENNLFKSLDFGVNLGIGKKIILNNKTSLNIEIRDNLGLTNISKVDVYNNETVKNNSFNLILNWEFKI